MKTNLINAIKLVLADRLVTVLALLVILLAGAYCVYVGISIQTSIALIGVHYTAFGETNIYKDKWYYLLSFIAFGVSFAIIHTALILKFYALERRQLAIFFAGLSVLILMVAWALTHAVLVELAYPH